MPEETYRRLAQRLDAIPNGFPATESRVELELLAKIFAPKEAALAAEMRLAFETADEIAARTGMDPKTTRRTLKTMVRKGQIRFARGDRQLVFALMPFAVGFYEQQLPRMDQELAMLFERYYREAHGAFARHAPAINRVIPVEEAVPAGVEIYPFERASELLENAQAWGVSDCICRLQQKLIGKGCDRLLESCLVFAPVAGVFAHSETIRAINKEEALHILHDAEDAGLVHSPGNFRDGHNYICNCCTCCCGVLRSVAEFGIPTAIASSDFVAVVDAGTCAGCGDCLPRCQFGALDLSDDQCLVDVGCCVGCGLCVTVCPTEALQLERRAQGNVPPPPDNLDGWMAQRAQARGLTTSHPSFTGPG